MSNLQYDSHSSSYNSCVKQDMILSDEEEENATLAEPMTLEGAKQLAQSSAPAHAPTIANSINPLPHILPSPPHLAAPIHHIASQRPLLHLVSSPSPAPAIHSAALASHLSDNSLHSSIWTNPGTACEDEDSNEIANYPSTVDIEAIRDSPSPNGLSDKLVTINENWNCQEEHDSNHGHSEDDEDEDDSDVSDSDVSCSSSKSVKKEHNKTSRRISSHSESMTSKSDTDSKDSDDSSECSSSEDSSSGDETEQHMSHSKHQNHMLPVHESECNKLAKIDGKLELDPHHPLAPKSCVTSLLATDSKWQMRQKEKFFNPAIEKNEKLFKTVSGDLSDDESKEKVQHTIHCKSEIKVGINKLHNVKLENKFFGRGKTDHKLSPFILSSPELEEKRKEKQRELNREFDRLFYSSNPTIDQKNRDMTGMQRLPSSSYIPDFKPITSHSDYKPNLPSFGKEQDIKPKIEKPVNYITSSTDSPSSLSSSESEEISNPRKRLPCLNANAKVIKGKLSENSKSKVFHKQHADQSSKKVHSEQSTSHILPHKIIPIAHKKPSPDSYKCPNSDNKKEKSKSSPSKNVKASNIIAEPTNIVQPTIADVVKVGRRRSIDSEKSVDTQNDSSSSDLEDLNEKVDLDTEQTHTFSVSENNLSQGRLTMKIAAMKMAKFGKTGLREVTRDLPTRTLLSLATARRHQFQSSHSPPKIKYGNSPQKTRHKVKTAAERKTYVDALPTSGNTSRKKGTKGDMRVPASSLYKTSYGQSSQFDDEHDDIISHHFSHITNQQITDGLQVIDEEDLAAILPDVSAPHNLDPFETSRVRSQQEDNYIADSIVNEVFREDKRREINLIAKKKRTKENEEDVGELDFIPLDTSLNASNVSPDSGIQSVNGSPLHVGSPHTPFYSSNLLSNSETHQEETTGRFSPNFEDSPPPPTLLPAITPPHLAASSPRYYDSPDSPQMPSLKCQVFPPPWDDKSCDSADEPKEITNEQPSKPRRRGRPKGSKNKRNPYDSIWLTHKSKKEKSFKDLAKVTESNSSVNNLELGNNWRTSKDTEDVQRKKSGRPKKETNVSEAPSERNDLPKKPESDISSGQDVLLTESEKVDVHLDESKPTSDVETSESSEKIEKKKLLKKRVGRPGRPKKTPKSLVEESNNKLPPVTLASRKCFSEKIMHKIINEKVKSSEKSDKLTVNPMEEDLPKGDKSLEKKSKKKIKEGIPLEDRRKKRGRKKELPAIFEKVYGSMKILKRKPDKSSIKKKKKKKKAFKSKHKNIIDPVFLERLEDLILDFDKCYISKGFITPQAKPGEVLLPSIFRPPRKPLSSKKRRIAEKLAKASDRESGTEGEGNKEGRGRKERKKKQQELPKQGKERPESNEQRLPLKKRHRHISTAVPTCVEILKPDNRVEFQTKMEKSDSKSYISKSPSRNDSSKLNKSDRKLTERSIDRDRTEKYLERCEKEKVIEKIIERDKNSERNSSNIIVDRLSVKENYSDSVASIISATTRLSGESLTENSVDVKKKVANEYSSDNFQSNVSQKEKICDINTCVLTTPKKRHRLEAELSMSNVSSIAASSKKLASVVQLDDIKQPKYSDTAINVDSSLCDDLLPGSKSGLIGTDSNCVFQPVLTCDRDQSGRMSDKEELKIGEKKIKKRKEQKYPHKKQRDLVPLSKKQKEFDLLPKIRKEYEVPLSKKQKEYDLLPKKRKEYNSLPKKRKEYDLLPKKRKEYDSLTKKQKEYDLLPKKRKEYDSLTKKQKEYDSSTKKQKESDTIPKKLKESDTQSKKHKHFDCVSKKHKESDSLSKRQKEIDYVSKKHRECNSLPKKQSEFDSLPKRQKDLLLLSSRKQKESESQARNQRELESLSKKQKELESSKKNKENESFKKDLESVRKQKEYDSHKKHKESESPKKQKEGESSKKHKEIESSKKQKELESSKKQKEFESTKRQKEFESNKRQKEFESTKRQKDLELIKKQKEFESSKKPKELELLKNKKEIDLFGNQKDLDSSRKQKHFDALAKRHKECDSIPKKQKELGTLHKKQKELDSHPKKRKLDSQKKRQSDSPDKKRKDLEFSRKKHKEMVLQKKNKKEPDVSQQKLSTDPSQTRSPIHRKKVKRRKTNRTGFPVIRKKKPKPKLPATVVPEEKPEDEKLLHGNQINENVQENPSIEKEQKEISMEKINTEAEVEKVKDEKLLQKTKEVKTVETTQKDNTVEKTNEETVKNTQEENFNKKLKVKKAIEKIQEQKIIDKPQEEKLIETTQADKLPEKTQVEKVIESAEAEKITKAAEAEKIIETGEAEKVIETEAEKIIATAQAEKIIEAVELEKIIEISQPENSIEKTLADKSIKTEQTEKPIEKAQRKETVKVATKSNDVLDDSIETKIKERISCQPILSLKPIEFYDSKDLGNIHTTDLKLSNHTEDKKKQRGRRAKRDCTQVDSIKASELKPSKTIQESKVEVVDKKASEDSKETTTNQSSLKTENASISLVEEKPRHRKSIPKFLGKRKRDASEDSILPVEHKRPRTRAAVEEEVEDSDAYNEHPSSEPASSDESCKIRKIPRWRKKFIIAGLFSDYYKQDEPRRNGDLNKVKANDPEKRNHSLLPPPLYCKKQLRERYKEFLLPYDLWFLHTNDMLPGRDLIASWNYKKVKSNVYYDVKPTAELDVQSCNCKKSGKDGKGCGDDCINRMMYIECSIQICPLKEKCTNQRLQKHESLAHLRKFMTEDKGWGIKTTAEIKQSGFIMEYVGEVVSEREFRHRMHTKYANDTHHYCLNLDRGMMIDGHRIGSDCRFVNHSCAPNCEMQKWNVNGQYRMALFALEDIAVGEELTYDYNFHLFNPARGQQCKCRAENCRGVIGGKSQRLNGHHPVDDKKKQLRNKKDFSKKRKRGSSTDIESLAKSQFMPMKPLSHQQKIFILSHRCFLLKNLNKIRQSRGSVARYEEKKVEEEEDDEEEPCSKIQRFITHFTALNTARSVKTRRLAQAEDDPEMTRVAKLAQIFKDIYDKLVASRDNKEKPLATPFMNLFSKKKFPTYYNRVGEPIDLAIIEKNILTGFYTNVDEFDRDIMKLFGNNLRFFGRNTEIGMMAVGLRKVYSECKLQFKPLLEEVLGEGQLPPPFSQCSINEEFEDEDVIRCVCNLYRDEGMMIQCEKCLVWQHCDCMGVDEANFPEHYHCEECSPRLVSPEVPMNPQPPDSADKKYFVTLLRDSLQIKQGDSVYILRDRPKQKTGDRRQPAYKLAKDVKVHDLLIFKVENLFIDDKGDKYAFGHHFLRPHETFHEPWRKFFANEVIRSPFCEILALDMIIRHCWVMDLNSYCRGKPIGSHEEHIYVCECRVDKAARVFSKISKPKYPICKKPYAFIQYPEKLRPQRTYTPHEVTCSKRGKSNNEQSAENTIVKEETKSSSTDRSSSGSRKPRSNTASRERSDSEHKEHTKPNIKVKKRERINTVATRLLKQLPSKGAVDMAFLLKPNTGKRCRKKTHAFAS